METVYIETTIVSYLVANASLHPLTAARQEITLAWWTQRRGHYLCVTSDEVAIEAERGDTEQVKLRLAALQKVPRLPNSAAALELAERLKRSGIFPARAASDATHVALAAGASVDFLLTWNFRHLLNGEIRRQASRLVRAAGFDMPTICTPEELMGD
jgi:hypothetical protein